MAVFRRGVPGQTSTTGSSTQRITESDLCLEREKVQWKYLIKASWQFNLDKAIGNIGK